jgi:YggT family protein
VTRLDLCIFKVAAQRETEVKMTHEHTHDADRVEQVNVSRHGSSEYVEHVVDDAAAAQRTFSYQVTGLLWLLLGALEALLGLRLILKLLASNPGNPFASLIYTFSDIFVWPFIGLTITPSAAGIVVEIHTIIAMVVYAMLGWLFISLVRLLLFRRTERSVSIQRREHLP